MNDEIQVEREGAILKLTFNRPDKKNALTRAMYDQLADEILAAEDDLSISVIVLTGAGGNYTAGNDLKDFQDLKNAKGPRPAFRFIRSIAETSVPLVAAVDGVAVGVGMTMLLHCDMVFVTKDAKLSMPFVNLGLVPEAGSSYLLPKMLGYNRAAELLIGGSAISGTRAFDLGLANELCATDQLLERAMETAQFIASKPPQALRLTKKLLKGDRPQVIERIDTESEIFSQQLASDECAEAISAFFEKRPPQFNRG